MSENLCECGHSIRSHELANGCSECDVNMCREFKSPDAATANYSRREWLNPINSEATGSVVAFDGMVQRRWESESKQFTFLEIADCSGKVSLHELPLDGKAAFIAKMRLLAEVVTEFADCLEKGRMR